MGIGLVLILWAVVGTILAGIGSVIAIGVTAFLTKGVDGTRRKIIKAAGIFPVLCIAWAGSVFIFQWIVNESIFHRDAGLGDSWSCPLPDGYAILMIDVTDQGMVYNPKTQLSPGTVSDQEDAISGVRQMQVSGQYILLEADSKSFEHFGQHTSRIDSYILLDSKTGKRTGFSSDEALRNAAKQLGVSPKLEPIYSVYTSYRWTWFDWLCLTLLFLPPILCIFVWGHWALQLRKRRSLPQVLVNPT